jgi:hypothetical protein
MSDKLAISAAFSVLMMAGYVLLGADAVHSPIGPGSLKTQIDISVPALPSINELLPSIR